MTGSYRRISCSLKSYRKVIHKVLLKSTQAAAHNARAGAHFRRRRVNAPPRNRSGFEFRRHRRLDGRLPTLAHFCRRERSPGMYRAAVVQENGGGGGSLLSYSKITATKYVGGLRRLCTSCSGVGEHGPQKQIRRLRKTKAPYISKSFPICWKAAFFFFLLRPRPRRPGNGDSQMERQEMKRQQPELPHRRALLQHWTHLFCGIFKGAGSGSAGLPPSLGRGDGVSWCHHAVTHGSSCGFLML